MSVSLLIKNPSSSDDFKISIPVNCSVLELKQRLEREYHGHPAPSRQKLISFGRLLQDHSLLSELFTDITTPHTVHLVISREPTPQEDIPVQPNIQNNPNPAFLHQQRVQQMQQQQARNFPHQAGNLPPQAPQDPQVPEGAGQAPDAGNQGLMLKLTILVFILSQGGSTLRACFLLLGAFVLYLYLTGRFRIQIHHYAPRARNNQGGENEAEENVPAVNRGIMGEISDVVIPFISSLAPTWNPYEIDIPQEIPDVPPQPNVAM